jgi:hypothetical protein
MRGRNKIRQTKSPGDETVNVGDLKSPGFGLAGSSPARGTNKKTNMKIRTLEGDDQINEWLNHALEASVRALAAEGHITDHICRDFIDTHVVQVTSESGMWNRIKTLFKVPKDKEKVVVLKVVK